MKVLMILQLSVKKNVREKLGKNMIHELWFRNLQTNQNASFFKLQYLINELIYEVEFQYVVRHPQKQQIYPVISSEYDRNAWECPKLYPIVIQLHLNYEMSYEVVVVGVFLHLARDPQKLQLYITTSTCGQAYPK